MKSREVAVCLIVNPTTGIRVVDVFELDDYVLLTKEQEEKIDRVKMGLTDLRDHFCCIRASEVIG